MQLLFQLHTRSMSSLEVLSERQHDLFHPMHLLCYLQHLLSLAFQLIYQFLLLALACYIQLAESPLLLVLLELLFLHGGNHPKVIKHHDVLLLLPCGGNQACPGLDSIHEIVDAIVPLQLHKHLQHQTDVVPRKDDVTALRFLRLCKELIRMFECFGPPAEMQVALGREGVGEEGEPAFDGERQRIPRVLLHRENLLSQCLDDLEEFLERLGFGDELREVGEFCAGGHWVLGRWGGRGAPVGCHGGLWCSQAQVRRRGRGEEGFWWCSRGHADVG